MPNEKGYALIESMMQCLAAGGLFIAVMLIVVQSSIAVSRVAASRTEAHFAEMKWDLRNLAERQALHYADASRFTSSPGALRWVATDGVVVSIKATSAGWSGTASHASLGDDRGCAIFVGSAPTPSGPIQPDVEGVVTCTE